MPPTCSQCGGSGYGPPDMRYDGTEREPYPCEHCNGSGCEPVKAKGKVLFAPAGTTDLSEFKEVGYVAEDGYTFGSAADDVEFKTGGYTGGGASESIAGRVHSGYTIPIGSVEGNILDMIRGVQDNPEPVAVDFLQILDKARAYRQAEAQKELLKERLNLRWRYHRHPDARKLVLDYEGLRRTYPHAFITKNDTGFDVDPQPIPALDDPDYYLRNP